MVAWYQGERRGMLSLGVSAKISGDYFVKVDQGGRKRGGKGVGGGGGGGIIFRGSWTPL